LTDWKRVGKREAAASNVALRERDCAQSVVTLDVAAAELGARCKPPV